MPEPFGSHIFTDTTNSTRIKTQFRWIWKSLVDRVSASALHPYLDKATYSVSKSRRQDPVGTVTSAGVRCRCFRRNCELRSCNESVSRFSNFRLRDFVCQYCMYRSREWTSNESAWDEINGLRSPSFWLLLRLTAFICIHSTALSRRQNKIVGKEWGKFNTPIEFLVTVVEKVGKSLPRGKRQMCKGASLEPWLLNYK